MKLKYLLRINTQVLFYFNKFIIIINFIYSELVLYEEQ